MYEIYEGIKVPINRVTPYSVNLYKQRIIEASTKSAENISEVLEGNLSQIVETENDQPTIKFSKIKELILDATQKSAVGSLDMYIDTTFIEKWIDVVFKISPEQIKTILECDFLAKECKFSWDEFARGYKDFFMRALSLSS